ncbi:DUF1127 domain-containing protein [Mesorhizobium sp. KR9-304]|uniref:DUF1127 domain-containing protein n=1 Tax=Mesorhizobium sp. KR9-304 TaxID=3156614 RepID=UPI0032B5A379
MTDTSFEHPKAGSEASPPGLRSFAASMLAGVLRALAVRRDRRLLHALPDSLLKDIGINRGNIDYVATRDECGGFGSRGDSLYSSCRPRSE